MILNEASVDSDMYIMAVILNWVDVAISAASLSVFNK